MKNSRVTKLSPKDLEGDGVTIEHDDAKSVGFREAAKAAGFDDALARRDAEGVHPDGISAEPKKVSFTIDPNAADAVILGDYFSDSALESAEPVKAVKSAINGYERSKKVTNSGQPPSSVVDLKF
jgi:hypothetical protein